VRIIKEIRTEYLLHAVIHRFELMFRGDARLVLQVLQLYQDQGYSAIDLPISSMRESNISGGHR